MTILSSLFTNSIKNNIDEQFVQALTIVLTHNPITEKDFSDSHPVQVYAKEEVENYRFQDYRTTNTRSKNPLEFSDNYEKITQEYTIFDVWLLKLGENLRRLYNATKNNKPTNDLYSQQQCLFIIAEKFCNHFQSSQEPKFFPRSIFGKNYSTIPSFYMLYLGSHSLLKKEYISTVSKIIQYQFNNAPTIDSIPKSDFIRKMSLNKDNQSLLQLVLPKLSEQCLIESLLYGTEYNSYAFNLLGLDYLINKQKSKNKEKETTINQNKNTDFNTSNNNFEPSFNNDLTNIIKSFIYHNVFFSKYFDYFISEKQQYLTDIAHRLTKENKIDLETNMINKEQFKNYELVRTHLLNPKFSNPNALIKDLKTLSSDEITDKYSLEPEFIHSCIQTIAQNNIVKTKLDLIDDMTLFVSKAYPLINEQHITQILSLNSSMISICSPLYMNLKLSKQLLPKQEKTRNKQKI